MATATKAKISSTGRFKTEFVSDGVLEFLLSSVFDDESDGVVVLLSSVDGVSCEGIGIVEKLVDQGIGVIFSGSLGRLISG